MAIVGVFTSLTFTLIDTSLARRSIRQSKSVNKIKLQNLLFLVESQTLMNQSIFFLILSTFLAACSQTQTASNSAKPWWVISLIGFGILCLIWFTRNRPGWTFEGPSGCPTEIARVLGILFALALLIFGVVGAFNPHALSWLDTGISVLNNIVSAWEITIGLILFSVFIYFLIFRAGYRVLFRRSALEEGEGCSFVFWTIIFTGYVGWLIYSGYWKEFVDPFINLYHLWFG